MGGNRRTTILLLSVLLAIAACDSAVSADDHGAGSTQGGAGPTSASGAGASSSGGNAGEGGSVPMTGGGGATGGSGGRTAVSPCDGDPSIVFCADFDAVAEPKEGWSNESVTGHVVADLDDQLSVSPPRSLRVAVVAPLDEEAAYVLTEKTTATFGATPTIEISGSLRASAPGNGEIVALDMGANLVRLRINGEQFQLETIEPAQLFQLGDVVWDTWTPYVLRIDATGSIELQFAGMALQATIPAPLTNAEMVIRVGFNGITAGVPLNETTLQFDDVVVRATP